MAVLRNRYPLTISPAGADPLLRESPRSQGASSTFLCGTTPPEPVKGGIVSLRSVREFQVKID
jgi:hypothetical protein